ncbi:hypothetical protein VRC60_03335 [Erwinia sp. E_sp_B04_7]|uniref:hypothetical protein n=2 Tax=unclassified Erwinia TaxID=2622719 RepID=UPI0030CB84FA
MEKSLKSTNSNFSLASINFSGFSSSDNWVGYFEKKNEFNYGLIDESISLFSGFFEVEGDDSTIITALSFDDEREDDVNTINIYQKLYEELKSKGVLNPMTEDYESYLYGDIPLPANALNISFDNDDFINASRLLMCHAGVVGQVCFYINTKLNVAIYPHDEVGFGCIALNSEKKQG